MKDWIKFFLAVVLGAVANSTLGASGTLYVGRFQGDGAGLTNIQLSALPAQVVTNGQTNVTLAGTFNGTVNGVYGDGANTANTFFMAHYSRFVYSGWSFTNKLWVDGSVGNDTNSGTNTAPLKNLTAAITVASNSFRATNTSGTVIFCTGPQSVSNEVVTTNICFIFQNATITVPTNTFAFEVQGDNVGFFNGVFQNKFINGGADVSIQIDNGTNQWVVGNTFNNDFCCIYLNNFGTNVGPYVLTTAHNYFSSKQFCTSGVPAANKKSTWTNCLNTFVINTIDPIYQANAEDCIGVKWMCGGTNYNWGNKFQFHNYTNSAGQGGEIFCYWNAQSGAMYVNPPSDTFILFNDEYSPFGSSIGAPGVFGNYGMNALTQSSTGTVFYANAFDTNLMSNTGGGAITLNNSSLAVAATGVTNTSVYYPGTALLTGTAVTFTNWNAFGVAVSTNTTLVNAVTTVPLGPGGAVTAGSGLGGVLFYPGSPYYP